jgi:hypothetical protein
MMRGFCRVIALVAAAGLPGTAPAPEFIAKPGAMTVQAGAELQIVGLSSHVFLIGQELEAQKDVKIGLYADGKRTDIAVKPNKRTLAYDGTVTAPSNVRRQSFTIGCRWSLGLRRGLNGSGRGPAEPVS